MPLRRPEAFRVVQPTPSARPMPDTATVITVMLVAAVTVITVMAIVAVITVMAFAADTASNLLPVPHTMPWRLRRLIRWIRQLIRTIFRLHFYGQGWRPEMQRVSVHACVQHRVSMRAQHKEYIFQTNRRGGGLCFGARMRPNTARMRPNNLVCVCVGAVVCVCMCMSVCVCMFARVHVCESAFSTKARYRYR